MRSAVRRYTKIDAAPTLSAWSAALEALIRLLQ